MTKPFRILFILADGARARFVARSPGSDDFVTLREVDGSERLQTLRRELRASPPGRSHESSSPNRRTVGREDFFRQAKEAFVAEVADLAADAFPDEAGDGVAIAAPSRLLGPLRTRLEPKIRVLAELSKDLTKIPDHELSRWLNKLEVAAEA